MARIGFGITVAVAIVCGYIGLTTHLSGAVGDEYGSTALDILYYDLQLFVLGSAPLEAGGPLPVPLEIARLAAPAATVYALFEAGRALVASRWRDWRHRRRSGHVIVVGTTRLADAIATRVRASGQAVVEVAGGSAADLAAAGVAGARTLYSCGADGVGGGLATALAAARAERPGSDLRIYAEVGDPLLSLALRARRLGLPAAAAGDLQLDFFNRDELAARVLMRGADPDPPAGVEPHLLVAGLGAFGQAVIAEFARQWRIRSRRRSERVPVTLVDPAADAVARGLPIRWPAVAEVCDLRPAGPDLAAALATIGPPGPHRAFLCWEDEALTLRAALTVSDLWSGRAGSVVVRLDELAGYSDAFRPAGIPLLDDLRGSLTFVAVTELAGEPMIIEESLVERLARAIHERYLLDQMHDGVAMGANDSMTSWEALADERKDNNRNQARDIGTKLAEINCAVAPRSRDTPFRFGPAEIEALSRNEHRRWCDDRLRAGWQYGPTIDYASRRHSSLVPWEQLSESEREKDRDVVRNLPAILADEGLQVVRLDP